MNFVIGIITISGLCAGMYELFNSNRKCGIINLVISFACPIIIRLFCLLKPGRAFGGTDWEFLVHSATVDGDIWPWIALFLLIAEIVLIFKTIFKGIKTRTMKP